MSERDTIKKLKDLADDHYSFAAKLEAGEITNADPSTQRIQTLISTYRHWGNCISLTVWLLESGAVK